MEELCRRGLLCGRGWVWLVGSSEECDEADYDRRNPVLARVPGQEGKRAADGEDPDRESDGADNDL